MNDTPDTATQQSQQQIMAAVQPYRSAAMDAVARRDYATGEKAIAEWEAYLDSVDTEMTPLLRGFLRCQMNDSGGNLWFSHAMYDYYMTADFIQSPSVFETAEGYFERAVASLSAAPLDKADANLAQLCRQTLALPQSNLLDARGMKLMTQGEFQLEIAALLRAQNLLSDAVKCMRDAITARTAGINAENGHDLGAPLFVDRAEAMLHQAQSDQALLAGDLKAAAAAEGNRAESLDRAQAVNARQRPYMGETNTYFTQRLARDAFVARQRQDRLLAAASAQPQTGWLRATVFVVLALGALALFIGGDWYTKAGLMNNKFVVATVVVYAFLVAGVGSRLAQWGDAADRLGRIMTAISGDKDKDKAQDKKS